MDMICLRRQIKRRNTAAEKQGVRVGRIGRIKKPLLSMGYFRISISRRIGGGCRMASNPSACWHRASSFEKGNWGGQSERYCCNEDGWMKQAAEWQLNGPVVGQKEEEKSG
jgi:hypothetical protein